MKVGDLIRDKAFPGAAERHGIIVYKDEYGDVNAYRLLYKDGKLGYESKDYVESRCEVISEAR